MEKNACKVHKEERNKEKEGKYSGGDRQKRVKRRRKCENERDEST